MGLRSWCACLILAASAVAAGEQAPPLQPSFKSGMRIVSIFATVSDADRRLVTTITQDDFEIIDNEKHQLVAFFNNEEQPITVLIMHDNSMRSPERIVRLRAT